MLAFVDLALVSRRGIAGLMGYDQGCVNRRILEHTRRSLDDLLHHCSDIRARMLHSLLKFLVSILSRNGSERRSGPEQEIGNAKMTNKSGALGFATCIRLMKRDIKSQAWLDSLPLVPRSVCFTFCFWQVNWLFPRSQSRSWLLRECLV